MKRTITYSFTEDFPTVVITCDKNDLDDFMPMVPLLYREWDFKTRYSISNKECKITLYEMKRKEVKNAN